MTIHLEMEFRVRLRIATPVEPSQRANRPHNRSMPVCGVWANSLAVLTVASAAIELARWLL